MTEKKAVRQNNRFALLDSVRGLALINMILYHAAWNMVYLYGIEWDWYHSRGAFIWQQSICCTFILLSGFCWSMGKNHWKNGFMVFTSGFLVTIVTLWFIPQNRVVFGVLTCIGSCILLLNLLERIAERIDPQVGMAVSILFFVLTRRINAGYLSWGSFKLLALPKSWYKGSIGAFLGFTPLDFYSTDYFSLFPWLFLFLTGYFLYRLCEKKGILEHDVFRLKLHGVEYMGRNSLFIYLLHQPILYFLGNLIW